MGRGRRLHSSCIASFSSFGHSKAFCACSRAIEMVPTLASTVPTALLTALGADASAPAKETIRSSAVCMGIGILSILYNLCQQKRCVDSV